MSTISGIIQAGEDFCCEYTENTKFDKIIILEATIQFVWGSWCTTLFYFLDERAPL